MDSRQTIVGIAVLLFTSGATAMGVLPTGNVIECTTFFAWGRPSASRAQADGMEPVEVCLRSKERRDLVLRVPAAFLDAVIRDSEGRVGFVHWEFWMLPNPRPLSNISELRQSVPEGERAKFLETNEIFRIRISLGAELIGKERYEAVRRAYLEHNERLTDEPFGLEHFTQRPCTNTKSVGGGIVSSSTKCAEGTGYDHVYFGRSGVSDQRVIVNCHYSEKYCTLRTSFRNREMSISVPRKALGNWRWYEENASKFLQTYVVKVE
jgi:hypothetical protein